MIEEIYAAVERALIAAMGKTGAGDFLVRKGIDLQMEDRLERARAANVTRTATDYQPEAKAS